MAVSRGATSSLVQGLPKYRSMLGGNTAYSPASFESIATLTSNGSVGTLTFTSIPQTYKHLHVRGIVRSTNAGTSTNPIEMRFNATGGYAKQNMLGSGSAPSASASASIGNIYVGISPSAGFNANIVGVFYVDILDYTDTTKYKVARGFSGIDANGAGSNVGVQFTSGMIYNSTVAVTSLEFADDNGNNLSSLTEIALYGIKA